MSDLLEISHHFIGGELYSKRTTTKAGIKLIQHAHPYDHASALITGVVDFEVEGLISRLAGPVMLMVPAGKVHSVTAITDIVWHCIHITADTDPETIDQSILRP